MSRARATARKVTPRPADAVMEQGEGVNPMRTATLSAQVLEFVRARGAVLSVAEQVYLVG